MLREIKIDYVQKIKKYDKIRRANLLNHDIFM